MVRRVQGSSTSARLRTPQRAGAWLRAGLGRQPARAGRERMTAGVGYSGGCPWDGGRVARQSSSVIPRTLSNA